jgi:hypothetical protein
MALTLPPQWLHTADRLTSIPWGRHVGEPLPSALAEWCTPVARLAEASALLGGDAWEEWSLGNHNALTLHLHDKHRRRYQDWNRIARDAKDLLVLHEPAIRAGLAAAGLSDPVAFDTVRWDVVGALLCAAYLDCRVPMDTLRLLDVYEAGHLPVGCDAKRGRVLVF